VQFRLIYKGPLPTNDANSAGRQEIRIRRCFHEQLKTLWSEHLGLRKLRYATEDPNTGVVSMTLPRTHSVLSTTGSYYFLPLVGENYGMSCSLDITFLRRDAPGGFIRHGGDIDNRLKLLLDAMRIPDKQHLPSSPQPPDEVPLLCVMSDDKFVDEIKITTDRLLTPMEKTENVHDVLLLVRVRTLVFDRASHVSWLE
jgi:hypothetical protein